MGFLDLFIPPTLRNIVHKCFSPGQTDSTNSTKESDSNAASNSTVNVDFTNTGTQIVTITFSDHAGNQVGPITIRPNQFFRRTLEVNFSYFFTFGCGRHEKTTSQTFTSNATVDVNKYFI